MSFLFLFGLFLIFSIPGTAGAELVAPSYWGFINSIFLPTVVFYTVLWFAVYACVQYNCWLSWQEGIKRKRLLNLTTSLIHSTVGSFLYSASDVNENGVDLSLINF